MDLQLIAESIPQLLSGVPLTLQLVVLSLFFGAFLAVGTALMRLSPNPLMSAPAYGYVFVFRGTPLLVQIFLVYYGVAQLEIVRESFLWAFLKEPYWCAILALTLNTGAYGSEIVRGGLLSVPRGQMEAARACGMSGPTAFRRIVFPQALRQALPAYSNEIILMVKGSSLASTITLMEITGIAKRLISNTFAPIEIFIVAGSIYLAINYAATRAIAVAEWRLTPHQRPRIDPTPAPRGTGLPGPLRSRGRRARSVTSAH
ncbi:MAG: ABC transporter permease subunit [Alphaproteobacteria bacterium]|jgi:octopine/nopaline transport system permease protein|nr:ABC transporter permease subunit [Alphaproteobacteria bacterium]